MLTNLEKRILNYLISSNDGIVEINSGFPSISPRELYNACNHLKNNNYLEDVWVDMSLNTSVMLSYKGQHYREFAGLELKEFFMKSLITPIGVALVTSLVTLWLNGQL